MSASIEMSAFIQSIWSILSYYSYWWGDSFLSIYVHYLEFRKNIHCKYWRGIMKTNWKLKICYRWRSWFFFFLSFFFLTTRKSVFIPCLQLDLHNNNCKYWAEIFENYWKYFTVVRNGFFGQFRPFFGVFCLSPLTLLRYAFHSRPTESSLDNKCLVKM